MSGLTLKETAAAAIPTPASGKSTLFLDSADSLPKYKDDTGTTNSLVGATGATGATGAAGADGADGVGVPAGGTTNQVLAKIDGTDYNTQWVDPSAGGGGGLVFRERHVASSSSSLDFTTFLNASYDKYRFIGESLVLQTSTADLLLEVGTGGGPTYDTGNNYEWARLGLTTAGTGANDSGSSGIARIFQSVGTTSGWAGSFVLDVMALASTSLRKTFIGTMHYIASTPVSVVGTIVIQWTTTGTAASAVRFIPSSGNIVSGSITAYGYTNS